jgi:hypothetical protein
MNGSQAYQYFVLRAQKIALSHGFEIVNWYEQFWIRLDVKFHWFYILSNHAM